MQSFPSPKGGASLLLAFRLQSKTTLILGSGTLAASRTFAALEADSQVVVIAKGGLASACAELKWRAQQGQISVLDWDSPPESSSSFSDTDALRTYLASATDISLVCVTDTISGSENRRTRSSAEQIYHVCRDHNILANVTDMPDLCDFTFPSTHRFTDSETGENTHLQVSVTTNGRGCRLAGRVRREVVAQLPKQVGRAVENIGKLRELAKVSSEPNDPDPDNELHEDSAVATPNRPVPPRNVSETAMESARRRMKWVAQISEYWSIEQLANMQQEDMDSILNGGGIELKLQAFADKSGSLTLRGENSIGISTSQHTLDISISRPPHGKIFLVGSGPGHPSLLTIATHTLLTKHADLVLSDKLVPAAVLAVIPKKVEVRIARKFPGNAEGAQKEMMEAAIEAAREGLTVVRLKQGDPVVYGRAGEEVLYFRSHGFEPLVVPGVSSALAAPTFAGIPVTQRGAAESFVVCTGVGRSGKDIQLPGYDRPRTLVILMGVARLAQVLKALLLEGETRRDGQVYPSHTPVAIIERASMPDQRVIESTLQDIADALESIGEQRPPAMMVVGWSVLALRGQGDVTILDEGANAVDKLRIRNWLGTQEVRWRVREGLQDNWKIFQD